MNFKISVIIPTYQAEKKLDGLLSCLEKQTVKPDEVIIIDSSSNDQTVKIAEKFQALIHVIPKKEFRHSRTRNIAAKIASGDILIFLTQDALPLNEFFVQKLIESLIYWNCSAITARQIAYDRANPLEKLARKFNYPLESSVRSKADIPFLGIKTFFFSDTASAIFSNVFRDIGGFSETIIVNEDMDLCSRMILSGDTIGYQSDAIVYHSHDYSMKSLFKRYFDIGVYFFQAKDNFSGIKTSQEGFKFVKYTINNLLKDSEILWIFRFLIESFIKFFAFRLGYNHTVIPIGLKKSFSNQPDFWISEIIVGDK